MRSHQAWVRIVQQHREHGEIGQCSQQTTTHDDGLATHLVRQGTKHNEEGRTNDQRRRNQQIGGLGIYLGDRGQKEQGVELAGVPDHRLASGQTDQRQDHDLQVFPLAKGLGQRCLGGLAFCLHFGESGRLIHGQTDIHGYAQQENGQQEWNAPAPDIKVCTGQFACYQNNDEGEEQTQSRCGLNPGGVGTALAMGRVLGHIGGSATVFTAQCQALQHAQDDQDDGGGNANGGVIGQQSHDEGGRAHDQNRDQEGVLAANHVTQTAKHQRAKGPHQEASSKRQQRKNVG